MMHVVLPTQDLLQAGQRMAEPPKRLMLAVLRTVVQDYGGGSVYLRAGHRGVVATRKVADDPAAYVASKDRSWPFSFENLCEAIGIDPHRLRLGLQETARTR